MPKFKGRRKPGKSVLTYRRELQKGMFKKLMANIRAREAAPAEAKEEEE